MQITGWTFRIPAHVDTGENRAVNALQARHFQLQEIPPDRYQLSE